MHRLRPSFRLSRRLTVAAGLLLAAAPTLADPIGDQALASLQAAYAAAVTPGDPADRYRELLATVLQRVERSYALDVDGTALVSAAQQALAPLPPAAAEPAETFRKTVHAALRTLDPYSRYLDPQAYRNERSQSSGSFGGLGLEVESGEGAVRVVAPTPGSPAARAGLQPGDLIVRLDDQPLAGVPLQEAIARMRGEPGTTLSLTIRRPAPEQEFTVSLTRDTIRRELLKWSLEGEVLVLRLGTFMGPASAAVEQAVAQASATQAVRGVVLDLRGNGGGLVREAVKVADGFLAGGEIASMRGRSASAQRSWQADAAELLPGVPMVVLVDRRSASASELVAAALQENERALVMGQRSFGKGTVQSTISLGGELGALKLTTAHYYAPSGRVVQKVGVAPDIELAAGAATPAGEAPPRPVQARIDPAQCAAVFKAADPGLACAVGYLGAASVDQFVAATAGGQTLRPAAE